MSSSPDQGPTPRVWLGAPSPGGLALPNALPAADRLYAPRGVWLDDRRVIVVDSGNHRVLIWFDRPTRDHAPADVVLGQPDFSREGPAAGGRGPENGLHLPTGVLVVDGRLCVADAWHHRVLIWNRVPESSDVPPDVILGQPTAREVDPNGGGAVTAASLYWPYGIGYVNGRFLVADTGNRRVLAWRGVPEPGQPADVVLGQDAPTLALENRGAAPTARSFRWPHGIAGDADALFVADAGNHRVLAWAPPPDGDRDADAVLGQSDFTRTTESPYAPQSGVTLRFPYAVASDASRVVVADTANNRVLVYAREGARVDPCARLAIGQADLRASGENRWQAVRHDTLCWPYGIALCGDHLAVADSGNNRVMIWQLAPSTASPDSTESTGSTGTASAVV